ncbi:hypothetical protein FJZ31_04055 [Candidatus Poribacteria bacterium]|nr:hypothetical protein [Candidatus Poribacteria bacterium]
MPVLVSIPQLHKALSFLSQLDFSVPYSKTELHSFIIENLCVDVENKTQRAKNYIDLLEILGFIELTGKFFILRQNYQTTSDKGTIQDLLAIIDRLIKNYNETWYTTYTRWHSGGRLVHTLFEEKHPWYRQLLNILANHQPNDTQSESYVGLSKNQIINLSKGGEAELNNAGVEEYAKWGMYAGIVTKNQLYTSEPKLKSELWKPSKHRKKKGKYYFERYYFIAKEEEDISNFQTHVETFCSEFRRKFYTIGGASRAVPIPVLREYVCEELRLHREIFDNLLIQLWRENKNYRFVRPPLRNNDFGSVAAAYQIRREIGEDNGDKKIILKDTSRRQIIPPITINGYDYFYLTIS